VRLLPWLFDSGDNLHLTWPDSVDCYEDLS